MIARTVPIPAITVVGAHHSIGRRLVADARGRRGVVTVPISMADIGAANIAIAVSGSGRGVPAVRPQALGKIMFRRRQSLLRWRVSRTTGAFAQTRQTVRAALTRWGWDQDRTATALLVASEMVTNARVHTTGDVRLTLRRTRRGVRVSVFDTAAAKPVRRAADPEREGGFGLHILDTCTSRWGIRNHRGGKIVWADVDARVAPTVHASRLASLAPCASMAASTMRAITLPRPGGRQLAARLRHAPVRVRTRRRGLRRRHSGMLWGAVTLAP